LISRATKRREGIDVAKEDDERGEDGAEEAEVEEGKK
jgi:hypothetical protein